MTTVSGTRYCRPRIPLPLDSRSLFARFLCNILAFGSRPRWGGGDGCGRARACEETPYTYVTKPEGWELRAEPHLRARGGGGRGERREIGASVGTVPSCRRRGGDMGRIGRAGGVVWRAEHAIPTMRISMIKFMISSAELSTMSARAISAEIRLYCTGRDRCISIFKCVGATSSM